MNLEEKIKTETWLVLAQLKEDHLLTPENMYVKYDIRHNPTNKAYPSPENQIKIIKKLEHEKALKVLQTGYGFGNTFSSIGESLGLGEQDFDLMILNPQFETLYSEYSKYASESVFSDDDAKDFVVSLEGRSILINRYLLMKPRTSGKNMRFFEHIFENAGNLITRDTLPTDVVASMSNVSFSRVLNDLGFVDEILKAFIPRREKDSLLFRNRISKEELKQRGIKIPLLIQELKTAHIKNSPE